MTLCLLPDERPLRNRDHDIALFSGSLCWAGPHEEKVIQSVLSRDYTWLYTLLLQYLPLILPLFLSPSPYLRPKTTVFKSKYGWINIDPSTANPSRNHHLLFPCAEALLSKLPSPWRFRWRPPQWKPPRRQRVPQRPAPLGTGAPGSLTISFPHRDPRLRFRLCLEINKSSKQKAETNQFG